MTISYSVLHVYQDFYPKRGGIEDHILELCRTCPPEIRPTVLTSQAKQQTTNDTVEGVPIIRLGSWGRYYTPFCPAMPRYLRHCSQNILHVHLPCPMAVLAYLLARPLQPLVIGYHNDIVRPRALLALYRPFLHNFLQRAKRILVSSLAYLNSSPLLQPFRDQCTVIPYGLDLEQFEPTPAQRYLTDRITSTYPRPLILFVGRLCYYKGLEYLIPAMQQVSATLLIVGVGPLKNKLKQLVYQHQLTDKVIFVGAINEEKLLAYYRAAEMTVLPSTYRSEAFGLVQLKAHACGRPVISTNLPGVSSVNLHQQTGLVIQPRSTPALAEAINTLLAHPDLRVEMGQTGRRRVEQHYPIRLMTTRIQEVYQHIHDG